MDDRPPAEAVNTYTMHQTRWLMCNRHNSAVTHAVHCCQSLGKGRFLKVNKCKGISLSAALALLSGSARRVVRGEIGCSNWKKTLAYLLVLPGSRARIVRCGGRYDPQLVKRSIEWVSECCACRQLNIPGYAILKMVDIRGKVATYH